jgi:hypothetical protein
MVYIIYKKVNFDVILTGTLLYQCPIKLKYDPHRPSLVGHVITAAVSHINPALLR